MVTQELIVELQNRCSVIAETGRALFAQVSNEVGTPFRSSARELISTETSAAAERLRAEVRDLTVRLIGAGKTSPLVGREDINDVTIAMKTALAALRFKDYQSWDTYVLHDEDRVLGVRQAGQVELDTDTNTALQRFVGATEKIADFVALLVPGESVTIISEDDRFAKMAVDEARKSSAEDGRVRPFVGAVVVKDGRVLATAHRGEVAANHAEYIALEKKLENISIAGSTVYTTLEPCTTRNHPKVPCVERLIERKVARVVIGMLDPNPRIRGRGIWRLQEANIAVELFPHELTRQIEELNRQFIRSCLDSDEKGTHSIVGEPKEQMPEKRPKIRALSYGLILSKAFHGLVITNDGEPAYDVSIPQIQIGTAVLNIECDVPRLTHSTGDVPCQGWIAKSPQELALGSSLFEILRKENIAGVDLPIYYRDEENRWYQTLSRIERNVKASGGLEVRFIRQESLDVRSLPHFAESESTPHAVSKPNLKMTGFQYLWLKTDANHVWRINPDGDKCLLFTFVNNPEKNGKGVDALDVRAQLTFEWHTGAIGPNFSPLPWLDEEFSFVNIPLGVEKKLVVGLGLGPQQGWYGYQYKRTNANWQKGVSPLESNPMPDRGKMRLRLFASIGGKSEAVWMVCFSWRVEFNPNHPWFEQIDYRELKGLADADY